MTVGRSGPVAVIGGGANSEHEVSLESASGVAGALEQAGWDVVRLTIGVGGGWYDESGGLAMAEAVDVLTSCAAVFPVLHGRRGEDGTLAALCELARVPYVGSGVSAGAIAMDKWATKLVAEAVGVATAPGVVLRAGVAHEVAVEAPLVVKPVSAGSSHGVSLVRTAAELQPALERAWSLDARALVESRVVGREIDLAVIGEPGCPTVSPALEIRTPDLFDTDTKYGGQAEFCVPADLTPVQRTVLETAAVRVYDALGCRGIARVDFFLTDAGPVLNEVNTMPGFTAHSQVPRMFAAAGVSYPHLVDRLVRDVVG